MSSPVFLSSTALSIYFGNFRRANFDGVSVSCALFKEASMDSWVGELICRVCLRVLWVGASTSFSSLLCWSASQGERLSGTW